MHRLHHFCDNFNTWLNLDFTEACLGIDCPLCASADSLHFLRIAYQNAWHINIPEDWRFGDWAKVKLFPWRLSLPVASCVICQAVVKLLPAFLLRGTQLTLPALAFVAFAYENSDLSWRALARAICDEREQIAHSALYTAVHGLGKSAEVTKVNELSGKIDRAEEKTENSAEWSNVKSRKKETIRREKHVRGLLQILLQGTSRAAKFSFCFWQYVIRLGAFIRRVGLCVTRLYRQNRC